MHLFRRLQRPLAALLLPLLLLAFNAPAHAALVGTGDAAAAAEGSAQRQQLLTLLDRSDVREQLIAAGVGPNEARDRVAALSNEELNQLASRYPELPAGGNSLIGAAVFVFVLLLLTDILGFTDVFPFVNKTAR